MLSTLSTNLMSLFGIVPKDMIASGGMSAEAPASKGAVTLAIFVSSLAFSASAD